MQRPVRITSSLSRADARAEAETMAQTLVALGLTRPPKRMCVGLQKYGQGWAVYVGYQDTDDLPPAEPAPQD